MQVGKHEAAITPFLSRKYGSSRERRAAGERHQDHNDSRLNPYDNNICEGVDNAVNNRIKVEVKY